MNHSNMSGHKLNKTPRSARRLDRSMDCHDQSMVSIDHEYLGKVDQIEQQNKSFMNEIEKLHQAKALETQKTHQVLKEVDKLHLRI